MNSESIWTVTVPEGESGRWKVRRTTVSREDALLSAVLEPRRAVHAGIYTELWCGHEIIMSDTPAERRDHRVAYQRARGHVLITGLGLGMITQAVLQKPEVEHVTVIEQSPDVLHLVGPHLKSRFGERLSLIEANAFTWEPPKKLRFGLVWHDIWPTISADHLEEMARLKRRFGRRCDWQGCWAQAECRELRQLWQQRVR